MKSVLAAVCLSLALSLALTGCSGTAEKPEKFAGVQGQELYELAAQAMDRASWDRAQELLELLTSRFPFGSFAEQAELELIYVKFRAGDSEAAGEAAERFIRLHPDHSNVDYAHYMQGMIASREVNTAMLFGADRSYRDLDHAERAFGHFAELLAGYPDSVYAADARMQMVYLKNLVARYEIHVANYYFKRGAWLAATNRGRHVVERFPGTPAVPDGLAIMAQGYRLLGYEQESERARQVLAANYPQHPSLDAEGRLRDISVASGQRRSTLNLLTFGLLGRTESLRFDSRALYDATARPPRPRKEAAGETQQAQAQQSR